MRVTTKWDSSVTHYIGRGHCFTGQINAQLGNPYTMRGEQTRELVLKQFEAWARRNPAIMARIRSLPGSAVLGCYCAPKACHGNTIIKLWKEMHAPFPPATADIGDGDNFP